MGEFRMPSLGAEMEAGTLVEWRVKPGDALKRGDVAAVVETDKGLVEVEIWEAGVVESLRVAPGTKVPVGGVLATVRSEGAAPRVEPPRAPAVAEPPPPAPTPVREAARAMTPALVEETASATGEAPRVRASPAARQRARERGVDLSRVTGTGPHGAVTRDDVERAPGAAEVTPASPVGAPAARDVAAPEPLRAPAMRQAIAAAMARSKREIPHYYLSTDVDAERALAWLASANASRPVADRILFAAVLLRATALAVREVPELNGFFVDGGSHPAAQVHLGVAIALRQGGLIAPAIHDADRKSVGAIMADLRDLVARARAGRLRSSELSDPTITVTNLGDQGVQSVFGVIYPPQVALVGFGKPLPRAWAVDGMLGVHTIVTASLSADHRVSDGHRGGLFLAALARAIEEPERLGAP
jgi:pyruvate dehydrogenase E2 component (dihydrolipoamide acetyltransferase)